MALLSEDNWIRPWILATRPATLWAAVTPVLVGAAFAVADDVVRVDAFVVTLAAALAIQIGVNYANDLSDAGRGADTADRLGPARMVASGSISPGHMKRGVIVVFGIAAVLGAYLIAIAGWPIAVIGIASILAALGYTAGPAYGYHGLGEVFVFVFFGLVATVGSRYVHDRSAPAEVWFAAIPIGLLVTAILVINNLRDIPTDRVAGKRTLAVVLGPGHTRRLYAALIIGAFLLGAGFAVVGAIPLRSLAVLAVAPFAVGPVRGAARHEGRALIPALVATGRLHLLFGAVLAVAVATG